MRVECVPTCTGVAMPKPDQQAPDNELGCASDVAAFIQRMEAINDADAKLVRLLQENSEMEQLTLSPGPARLLGSPNTPCWALKDPRAGLT